ncbi:MAG: hypothetical protein RMJ44_06425 [Cytophagales bacterium]|nr:hypothetical protein [Bernardetiaceae bacterium]MDW8210706.1 hypothetical protein [Cytophagales bacterium]
MEDKLKTWAQQHRKEMDVFQAPEFLWERIAAQLDRQEKTRQYWWKNAYVRIAASIVLILVSATFLVLYQRQLTSENTLQAAYPELKQAEAYFKPIIAAKMRRIEQIGDKDLLNLLLEDLALLEKDYQTLAKDLQDHADNRQIIQAMIANYRSRLQLLERILNQLEQKQQDNVEL